KSQPEQNGFGLVDRMRLFFRQSQNRLLQDRWPGEIQVLLEMADAIISRDHYLYGVVVLLSQNKSKESCFAVAVVSDHAYTLRAVHLKTDVGEKLPRKIRLGKLVDLNHDGVCCRLCVHYLSSALA